MFFQVYLYMLYETSFYHGFTGIYGCRVSREPSNNGGGTIVMVPPNVPDWQNGKMDVRNFILNVFPNMFTHFRQNLGATARLGMMA